MRCGATSTALRAGHRWGNWRERQEFWLAGKGNVECKWIVQTATFPARRGNAVIALVRSDQLIGLFNESTGQAVNYLRTDPPSLLRLRDLWVSLLLLAGALSWLGVIGLVLELPAGLTYACAAIAVRLLVSRRYAGHIDEAFDELHCMQDPLAFSGGWDYYR